MDTEAKSLAIPSSSSFSSSSAISSLETGVSLGKVVADELSNQFDSVTKSPPQCELLGEFGTFGWWLQGLLGLLSFSSLLVKRFREHPRRRLKVFLFDSLKQATGAGSLHMMNLLCASVFSTFAIREADPCEWYLLNILLDTTIGVYFLYVLVQLNQKKLKFHGSHAFGYYGNPPSWRVCLRQVATWQFLVLLMKVAILLIMLVGQAPLAWLASALLDSLDDQPQTKLLIVMVLFPLTMNTLQYWVTDNIIKLHPEHDPYSSSSSFSSSSLRRESQPSYQRQRAERSISSDRGHLHLSFDDAQDDDALQGHARQSSSSSARGARFGGGYSSVGSIPLEEEEDEERESEDEEKGRREERRRTVTSGKEDRKHRMHGTSPKHTFPSPTFSPRHSLEEKA